MSIKNKFKFKKRKLSPYKKMLIFFRIKSQNQISKLQI